MKHKFVIDKMVQNVSGQPSNKRNAVKKSPRVSIVNLQSKPQVVTTNINLSNYFSLIFTDKSEEPQKQPIISRDKLKNITPVLQKPNEK